MDQHTESQFQMMPISKLRESPYNPRKRFDPGALQELADSIAVHGVITPMIARPVANGAELAAGHRRFRAAQLAGLAEVPVILRPMSDVQFLEILTVENLQREGVHPLEEAMGYQELRDRAGYDVASIATKIGRAESYVYGRLRLLNLIEPAQADFLDGRISFGHARLLAALPEEKQANGLKECFYQTAKGPVTLPVSGFKAVIEEIAGQNLNEAPFDLADAELLRSAGSCLSCPKSTCAEGRLFSDFSDGGSCFDRTCFKTKVDAVVASRVAAGFVQITLCHLSPGDSDVIGTQEYVSLFDPDDNCSYVEDAVIVDVHRRGHVRKICRDSCCAKHAAIEPVGDFGSSVQSARRELTPEQIERQREQKLEREKRSREEAVRAEVLRQVAELWKPEISDAGLRTVLLLHLWGKEAVSEYTSELAKELGLGVPKQGNAWQDNTNAREAVFDYCMRTGDGRLLKRIILHNAENKPMDYFGATPDILKVIAGQVSVSFEAVEKQLFAPVNKAKKARKVVKNA